MSRYACATDGNHATIRDGLRAAGLWVWDTHRVGGGFPDLLVWRHGFVLLEVKDPAQPRSKRALTDMEEAFHAACPGPVHVVETLAEAFRAVGLRAVAS